MSEPYLGEIRMFAGTFAPRGWALCEGNLLAISQNDALFSLLGTIYGGDGRTTFGLPDLRGRVPIHYGNGPGLSNRRIGTKTGAENVTLTTNELPSHTHSIKVSSDIASSSSPAGNTLGRSTSMDAFIGNETLNTSLSTDSITQVGGSQSHNNLQPFLVINFIIALVGIYPSRN